MRKETLTGIASWEPTRLVGPHGCAMRDWPRGTRVKIVNLENGRSSWGICDDYGPDARLFPERIIDVSSDIAKTLGFYTLGTAKVKLTRMS